MDIIYHHRIASKDGQYVHIEAIYSALSRQGHSLRLVGPALHEQSDFGHDGGIVSKLKSKLPKFVYELMELGYSAVVAYKLIKEIRKTRPDAIYERYNLFQPAGVMVANYFKIPLILEVNAPLKQERERFSGGLALPRLAKWIEDYTWKNADKVLPVSDVLADHCRQAGVSEGNIDVIHNGVTQSLIEKYQNADTASKDVVTIGFVGFMHLTCGVEEAIEVLAEVGNPKVKLVCVGDGNVLASLKEKAVSLGVEKQVSFPGLVSREDVMSYVENFDIALQPAVTEYASPLKMFEYMVSKSLIVAPDMANLREILTDDCAVFFDPDVKGSFKDALKSALEDVTLLSNRRQSAYNRLVDAGFSWDKNAERIVAHIEDLRS